MYHRMYSAGHRDVLVVGIVVSEFDHEQDFISEFAVQAIEPYLSLM